VGLNREETLQLLAAGKFDDSCMARERVDVCFFVSLFFFGIFVTPYQELKDHPLPRTKIIQLRLLRYLLKRQQACCRYGKRVNGKKCEKARFQAAKAVY
jgi:hypothetical protein